MPSQRVLEKNGFKQIGEEKKVMKVNGKWVDGFLYAIQE
ncbi:GNAT family N-acetyltransferase [Fusibacter sp. 3D3]